MNRLIATDGNEKRLMIVALALFVLFFQADAQQQFNTDRASGKLVQTLKYQNLTYDYGICNYIHHLLLQSKGLLEDDITIDSCTFKENPKTISDVLKECSDVNLSLGPGKRLSFFRNCFSRPLVLGGITGSFDVSDNSMPYLFLTHLRASQLSAQGNHIPEVIHLSNVHGDHVEINNNYFSKDTAQLVTVNSFINQLFFNDNSAKAMRMKFYSDTLGLVIWQNELGTKKPSKHQINDVLFADCLLRGDIWSQMTPATGTRSYRFYACKFQAGSRLLDMDADTIEFRDCLNFVKGVTLDADRGKRPTILKVIHSDLTNLDFDYDDRFRLYHWRDPDVTRSVFENLLVKFQNEKKLASYQQVDIEYFQFRHNAFVNFVAWVWWNYSYNKWLIILWTMSFLMVFTVVNLLYWDKVRDTYPIVKTNEMNGGGKFVKIFVYTALIFFSLKIDFNKLSFKHAGWLLYFFTQYMLGLLCLFFIANTIFKL